MTPATAERAPSSAKAKLEKYREAARRLIQREWGNQGDAAKEDLEVYEAYAESRKKANATDYSK